VFADGSWSPLGGAQSLVDALASGVLRGTGEIVVDSAVTGITVTDARVSGVTLEDGRAICAPVVVSNISALTTFQSLVGLEHFPSGFVKRLQRMRLSTSAVVLSLGTTLDLAGAGAAHETLRPLHYDHERSYEDVMQGSPGGMWSSVATLVDPGLAPPGHHTLTITSLAKHDIGRPWKQVIGSYTERMLSAWEHTFPGLSGSISFMESATPDTLERYTRNTGGAMYGWENIPRQTGGLRSPHICPLEGLFLAGHWSVPGSGAIRTLISGFHAAQMVLDKYGAQPIPFTHPMLPPAL